MVRLKVRKIGNSAGVTLPKEVMHRLKVAPGEDLFLTESPDGYRVTATNPEFERQMAIAESLMRRYRNALCVLAK